MPINMEAKGSQTHNRKIYLFICAMRESRERGQRETYWILPYTALTMIYIEVDTIEEDVDKRDEIWSRA